jgi:anti-sigma regulatory factor (Ser/Thr protein kinase)
MQQPASQTIAVLHDSDVGAARRAAQTMARTLGFEPVIGEEIALAVTELATNLAKCARDGKVVLTPLTDGARAGLQVESLDSGPGIADVDLAVADGFSTTGSRGAGLGAVNRLMDEFDIASRRGTGTHIVCRKWRREHPVSLRPCPLTFGVVTRPHSPGAVNGDAFVIKHGAESALVGIIDGLGHGQFAHYAAQTARAYVESHFELPLDQVFLGTGRACRATRGVVMALARFDWGQGKLAFASVGNIEARVFPSSKPFSFQVRRGIVGRNAPNAVVTEHPWPLENMMVLHSDGLRAHWEWKEFPNLAREPSGVAAEKLLRTLGTKQDDATVIVVRKVVP